MRVRSRFFKAKGLLAKDLHLLVGEVERRIPTLPPVTSGQLYPDLEVHRPSLFIMERDRIDLLAADAKGCHLIGAGLMRASIVKFSPHKKKFFFGFGVLNFFLLFWGLCRIYRIIHLFFLF
jgi:hypothetical protein